MSIIKKKKEKHDLIMQIGKPKLDIIEVLISKALFDPNISHEKFGLLNNVLREYSQIKEEIKTCVEHTIKMVDISKNKTKETYETYEIQ